VSKGRGFQPPQRGGGMGGMLQQVQRMQEEMLKVQEALKDEAVTFTAGGGAVTVVVTGDQKVVSIALTREAVDPEDLEMLQDLIVSSVNGALEKSRELAAERLGKVTGGLSIPGLT
jgi:DNA-binding YbaB/EbfC family protein